MQDTRNYQIIFLTSFFFLGICSRDWTLQPVLIIVIALSCLITQWVLSSLVQLAKRKDQSYLSWHLDAEPKLMIHELIGCGTSPKVLASLRSAAITALGLCLLLRGNSYQTMILAGTLAIASKFLFRWRSKHFFNPANFGIIAALILTNDAWVSPGQWGTDWWYLLLFAGAGGVVLKKVGRWDTSVAFFLTYGGLELLRDFWLGWTGDVWLHQLSSGSLLLFALFMLTDPRSIPNALAGRLLWAIAIAILTFVLQNYFYLSTAVFWALFIISPLTVLLDMVWSAPRFTWKRNFVN
ncbi:Na+-transporting NADH:ubiquinone oxidoreductase, subunit NqrB [Xenococcus sp. PCC 7305]|uniref:RnfABCDGE type electron transport complex subunit D n=1 Tax=Xenococcus sp. PCC 7305 TaxID=102125 RepID=UPI0002ABAE24|nr:RnfABCDGE type electron transport complex subunit D [Xenococcus sp. PCC 7305]ELS03197.1 Na+-transporting NADH:ubiquinone oxidoreductase, subunit NqrB [Xenococcus sp. PCC 7305]